MFIVENINNIYWRDDLSISFDRSWQNRLLEMMKNTPRGNFHDRSFLGDVFWICKSSGKRYFWSFM